MGAVGARPLIHGEGRDERSWRNWLAIAGVREFHLHERLASDSRLVVVAPHPDDEVLACGGLLSLHAARGGRALLVAVTDGEASHAAQTQRARAELARVRRAERLQGLARLGLPAPEIKRLALPDGKVETHALTLRSELLALLQPGDVIVSTWAHDGHPDHESSGRAARQAAHAAGCAVLAAPVWMWHWAAPGDVRVPWQRLQGLRLDDAVVARKRWALSAHASQLGPRGRGHEAVVGSAIQARAAWPMEYYFA